MSKQYKKWLAIMCITLLVPGMIYASSATCGNPWNCYNKGMAMIEKGQYDKAITELESAVKSLSDQAGVHRALGEAYEKAGKYQLASDRYAKQAAIYKTKGEEINTYLAAQRKADELNSTIEFYEVKPASASTATNLQKYEPAVGAYIGAFISSEQKYKAAEYLKWDGANEFEDFNELTGKQHSIFFDYGSIGSTLSNSFMGREQDALAAGAALHVAYEPNRGLDEVTESAVRTYAEELAALEVPVFLRYASEMNGKWVPWHGDPAKYIQKWRMVHDIMEQVAPNVAMVWSPSEMPLDGIEAYYPGDNYVDWVGISIYSAQFENGDAKKPTDRRNPLESVDYIYSRYASKKPIMISEYAGSHQAGFGNDKQDTSKFAKAKMTYFYESLKTKYPRVKCIQWYSNNNYNLADKSKNRVNYSLLDGQASGVLGTYKNIIADDYFLSNVVNGPLVDKQTQLPNESKKVQGVLKATGDVKLRTWVKSYDPYISEVVYKLNGQKLAGVATAPYQIIVPYAQLKSGENVLEATVFDSKGRVAKKESIKIGK